MKSPGATNTGAFARTLNVTADVQIVPQELHSFNKKDSIADLCGRSPIAACEDASESSTFVHISTAAFPILQRHWGALK